LWRTPFELIQYFAAADGLSVFDSFTTVSLSGLGSDLLGLNLARLYWKSGLNDKALEQAKSSVELAKADTSGFHLPPAAFEKFADAMDKGSMPTPEEFSK
jgi:hypothetical protein